MAYANLCLSSFDDRARWIGSGHVNTILTRPKWGSFLGPVTP